MSEAQASAQDARGIFVVPLRECQGRYRDYQRTTGPVDPNYHATLRALLQRSGDQVVNLAEIAGRIYRTQLFVSPGEPGLAYVEMDGNRVPVDQPRLEPVLRKAAAYVRDLQASCRVSDALSADT